jgi:hypothetical protein
MSLDFSLIESRPVKIFSVNITHNLGAMARAAGIYECLWHPEKLVEGLDPRASDIVPHLLAGILELLRDPEKYKALNPKNGWGDYEGLLQFAKEVLQACLDNPDARVSTSV